MYWKPTLAISAKKIIWIRDASFHKSKFWCFSKYTNVLENYEDKKAVGNMACTEGVLFVLHEFNFQLIPMSIAHFSSFADC